MRKETLAASVAGVPYSGTARTRNRYLPGLRLAKLTDLDSDGALQFPAPDPSNRY